MSKHWTKDKAAKAARELTLPCIAESDQRLDETLVDKGIAILREARALFSAAKCPKTRARIDAALSSALGARRNVQSRPYRAERPWGKAAQQQAE